MASAILAKGNWALVTGASAGIGQEFCRQLAALGMNVVMVARRKERIKTLATELAQKNHVQTMILEEDLTNPSVGSVIRSKVLQQGIKIRLLVNNAASGHCGDFEKESAQFYESMIRLNTESMVSLCREFLPDLTSSPPSAIVNVSSQAAYQPIPYMAVYAATKAFVHNFSLALYEEYRQRGVIVQTLVPGPTATEFDQKAGGPVKGVKNRGTTEEVVKGCLDHLEEGHPVVATVRGILIQRLFGSIASPKTVVSIVGKKFKPD